MPFTYEYPRPAVTVDAAVFRETDPGWQILLIRRGKDPFKGMWALPGGFLDMEETLEEAVARELEEETGLSGIILEQLHTFSAIHRDPRHRTISTVFIGTVDTVNSVARVGDDADAAHWFGLNELPPLAFDHAEIVAKAKERLLQQKPK